MTIVVEFQETKKNVVKRKVLDIQMSKILDKYLRRMPSMVYDSKCAWPTLRIPPLARLLQPYEQAVVSGE